jgi:hypothetical protein
MLRVMMQCCSRRGLLLMRQPQLAAHAARIQNHDGEGACIHFHVRRCYVSRAHREFIQTTLKSSFFKDRTANESWCFGAVVVIADLRQAFVFITSSEV